MKSVVRLATVDPSQSTRSSLKNLLLGIDMVWLAAECSRYEFFLDVVRQTQPDIALVSLDSDAEKALDLIAECTREVPTCSILVISESQEGSLILRAMRNGAREFLNFPLRLEDFMSALDRIRQSSSSANDGTNKASEVVTIAGVAGGIGCTSLAINMGCCLAKNPSNSVVILDLDMTLGDADVWLDIIPDYTIQDVAENIDRLDYSLLKRSLTKHECGVFLLPRPVRVDQRLTINPDELRRFVALLKATFTHLIIDTGKNFSDLDIAAMEVSETVLLITQLDLSCLRNAVRLMQFFEQFDGLLDKIRIVLNRMGIADNEISLNKALETIGRDVYWKLPNDYATMVESRNDGIPLCMQAPRSRLTKSIEALVRTFDNDIGELPEHDEQKKKKLFSFLGSGG